MGTAHQCNACNIVMVGGAHPAQLDSEPDTYEFEAGETDEIDIFERLLDAYDNKILLEEKESSTIN